MGSLGVFMVGASPNSEPGDQHELHHHLVVRSSTTVPTGRGPVHHLYLRHQTPPFPPCRRVTAGSDMVPAGPIQLNDRQEGIEPPSPDPESGLLLLDDRRVSWVPSTMYHEMRGPVLHLDVLRFRDSATYVSPTSLRFCCGVGCGHAHTPSERPPPPPLLELARQLHGLVQAQGHAHGRSAGRALYLHHLWRGVQSRR